MLQISNAATPVTHNHLYQTCTPSPKSFLSNPPCPYFNQPGVEDYKRNMFALLAKPGYEKETEAIRARLAK